MCGSCGVQATYVQATTDLTMSDLLKTMRSSEIFSVCGLPDVRMLAEKDPDGNPTFRVEVLGLDVFDPITMKAKHYKSDHATEEDRYQRGFSTPTITDCASMSRRRSSPGRRLGTV